jgi:WD40 repeat protein
MKLSSDNQFFYSASSDNTIRKWNCASGECLQELQGHSNFVFDVKLSSDNQYLYSASDDVTIRIWRCNNGKYVILHSSTVYLCQSHIKQYKL